MAGTLKDLAAEVPDSMERIAYVAVGAPVAVVKALSARVSDLRDAVRSSRKALRDDLAGEVEEWIVEGEEVIERTRERLRSSELAEEIRSSARSTREATRVGFDKAGGVVSNRRDRLEPDEELKVVKGIGPGYADKLGTVGIVGIARFLERTGTRDGIQKLAHSSGIPGTTLTTWRDQVDLTQIEGIGASQQDLLHGVGVWTVEQLAEASPSDLVSRVGSLDLAAGSGRAPTEALLAQWKTQAGIVVAG